MLDEDSYRSVQQKKQRVQSSTYWIESGMNDDGSDKIRSALARCREKATCFGHLISSSLAIGLKSETRGDVSSVVWMGTRTMDKDRM